MKVNEDSNVWRGRVFAEPEDGHNFSIFKDDDYHYCDKCGVFVFVTSRYGTENPIYGLREAYTCEEYRLRNLIK